jgi:hypothetical protein
LKQAKVETVVPVVYDAFIESLGFDTYTARLSDATGMEEFKDVLVKMSRSNAAHQPIYAGTYYSEEYKHVYIRLRLEPPPAPPAPVPKPAEDSCCVIQ